MEIISYSLMALGTIVLCIMVTSLVIKEFKKRLIMTIEKWLSDDVLFEQATVAMEKHYGSGCAEEIDAYFRGAKWMREKMYSEKDMRKAYCRGYIAVVKSSLNDCFYEWFEQFKKK